mgnify:CR=1 FL=1
MTHIVVLSTVIVGAVCLPSLLVVVCLDTLAARRADASRRAPGPVVSREEAALRSLDERVGAPGWRPVFAHGEPGMQQVNADLLRLGRQRVGGLSRESSRWQAAVLRAYDDRLRLASDAIGLNHRLSGLDGLDRELERVRVEGELQAAGIRLR